MSEAPPTAGWYRLDGCEVAGRLEVNVAVGLATTEARRRLERFGPNEIEDVRQRPLWRIVADQFADFMIVVLVVAAVISGLLGEALDAAAILAIVVLNAGFGVVQEERASRALAALRRLAAPQATVRRDGRVGVLPSRDLVPGDVVLLAAGDAVPADLRLLEAMELQLDEAPLTGESLPVTKNMAVLGEEAAVAERTNSAFKGTSVVGGRGSGVVVATGEATELGGIASLLRHAEGVETPLERRLTGFSRRLAWGILVLCAGIFALGLARGEPPLLMFLTAVSLAVAAVPEALPAVVTLSLAVGSRRMVRRHALLRRLPAAEALGSVSFICADKTGTLTLSEMRLDSVVTADGRAGSLPGANGPSGEDGSVPALPALSQAVALCLDVGGDEDERRRRADPTELALAEAAEAAGVDRQRLAMELPREAELPFDVERKRMSTLHRDGDGWRIFTKGAPEAVLAVCSRMWQGDSEVSITRQELLAQAEELATSGARVLAFAQRRLSAAPRAVSVDEMEREMTFLGFVGLLDPPRREARDAVAACRSAGITPVMITGDHPGTALAIARRVAIAEDESALLSGVDLDRLDDEELARRVEEVRVYARTSPQQKIRIVEALQRRGELVAMTGDGVNDAPALERADIGVAMGMKGTEVARQASDMVLLDDNFATIVAAVREGRRIFDNIRKFIRYTLTSNAGEIWTLVLAPVFGLPLPLLPIQILWINLVTDGLPGLALSVEAEERAIMRRPPRPLDESIFAHGLGRHVLVVGIVIGLISLFAPLGLAEPGSARWRTIIFSVLTFAQLVQCQAIRSERESLFRIGVASNRPLLGAVVLTVVMQLLVIYVPFLQSVFKTESLSARDLAICFTLPAVVLVLVEGEKAVSRWRESRSRRNERP